MYLGKRKIFNPSDYEEHRKNCLDSKSGATFIAFTELEGLLNQAELSRQYFDRSPSWFAQKAKGYVVNDVKRSFTESEYAGIAEAFRDIAKRLMAHADEIDAAPMAHPEE